eukprot:g3177.t1
MAHANPGGLPGAAPPPAPGAGGLGGQGAGGLGGAGGQGAGGPGGAGGQGAGGQGAAGNAQNVAQPAPMQFDASQYVMAQELRNEHKEFGREENILMGAVDMEFTINLDKPTYTEQTKVATMFRQKEFSTTGPSIIKGTGMTLEKFFNALAIESKRGRIIQIATARNAVNHVKTFRLIAKEADCPTSKIEEWAADLLMDASSLNVGPADHGRAIEIAQLRNEQDDLSLRIRSGDLDQNGAPLQQPVPGFQDQLVNMSRQEYGARINNYVGAMFIPMLKTRVEDGVQRYKMQLQLAELYQRRQTPYTPSPGDHDLYCTPVTREQFEVMKKSALLKSRMENLKCEDLPEEDW